MAPVQAHMTHDPLYIFAVLCLLVVGAEWLARRPGFRHLGSALLVILRGALVANLGVIPAGSPPDAPVPVYDVIFSHVAAVASQASVGGSTTALALAKSLGREDLLLPGILLGALGNAIGTFIGFLVATMI